MIKGYKLFYTFRYLFALLKDSNKSLIPRIPLHLNYPMSYNN